MDEQQTQARHERYELIGLDPNIEEAWAKAGLSFVTLDSITRLVSTPAG